MKFSYNFVRKGEVAPEKLEKNEFWLDVGNRTVLGVIDHHHGKVKEESAAELFRNSYKDVIIPHLNKEKDIVINLHERPDLDAIFTAWLLRKVVVDGIEIENDPYLNELVTIVSENDQGFTKPVEPVKNWVLVFRTILNTSGLDKDNDLTLLGLNIISKTYELLILGQSLEFIAGNIITIKAKLSLEQAYRDYLEDYAKGIKFQVKLPKIELTKTSSVSWSLTDGLYLREPKSQLFKELARSDAKNSELGLGYTLLITAEDLDKFEDRKLTHFVISTDPWSGLHLEGLGKILEDMEQDFEDKNKNSNIGFQFLTGRERVDPGKGRFGLNVVSPWYDGRGHSFTIIDSPSIAFEGEKICASQLSENEVLNAIWDYGDPAKFLNTEQASVTILMPVKISALNQLVNEKAIELNSITNEFNDEFQAMFAKIGAENTLKIFKVNFNKNLTIGNFKFTENYLLYFNRNEAVVISKLDIITATNLRELISSLNKANTQKNYSIFLPNDVEIASYNDITKLVTCRLKSSEISFENYKGNTQKILNRLSSGFSNDFFNRPSVSNIENSIVNISHNNKKVFYATKRGYALCVLDEIETKGSEQEDLSLKNSIILSLAMLQKTTTKNLFSDFINHRSIAPTNNEIINDRWKLMKIEQLLFIKKITEKNFGQRNYEAVRETMEIEKQLFNSKEKIEILAEQARDVKDNFLQWLLAIITLVITPIVLTTGFFSGIHLDKKFSEDYISIFGDGKYAGWLYFLVVLLVAIIICATIFLSLKFLNKRELRKNKF